MHKFLVTIGMIVSSAFYFLNISANIDGNENSQTENLDRDINIFECQRHLIPSWDTLTRMEGLLAPFNYPTRKLKQNKNSNIEQDIEEVILSIPVGTTVYNDGIYLYNLIDTSELFVWPPALGDVVVKRVDIDTWELKGFMPIIWKYETYLFLGLYKRLKKYNDKYQTYNLPLEFKLDQVDCRTISSEYLALSKEYHDIFHSVLVSQEQDQVTSKVEDINIKLLNCIINSRGDSSYISLFHSVAQDFPKCIGVGYTNIQAVLSKNSYFFNARREGGGKK